MKRIALSAPGKLILFGEYAVLFGAPAVVAAIDRRATVTLRQAQGETWEAWAPGLVSDSAKFSLAPGGTVCWRDDGSGRGSLSLVEKVINSIGTTGPTALTPMPPLAMVLDTRSFFEPSAGRGAKLGLGSSAALTVALATALEMWSTAGNLPQADRARLQRLVDLHRAVQGGAGSGIDVAASLYGGTLRYRLDACGSVAEVAPMTLPEGLRLVFAWTGQSASTGGFLERLGARREEEPQAVDPALEELAVVSSEGVAALGIGKVESFLEGVDAFWGALERLGGAIDAPILSEEHRILHRIAVDCGVHYKPSGAGGGDFGIGFTTEATAAAAFAERVTADGFRTFDLRIDPFGVEERRA